MAKKNPWRSVAIVSAIVGAFWWWGGRPRRQERPEGEGAPGARKTTKTTSAGLPPGIAKPLVPEEGPMGEGLQWSRFYIGDRPDRQIYIGDLAPGEWAVDLIVADPGISGGIHFSKSGQQDYGWNDAPPGGEGVSKAIIGVVNGALGALAPAGEVVATAYGVTPGVVTGVVKIVNTVLSAIPDAVKRGRVRKWSDWREGERGEPDERQRVKSEVAKWRDQNGLYALQGSKHIGYWHWEGSTGELPLTGAPSRGKPIPIHPGYAMVDAPSVKLEKKEGTDYHRLVLHMPATESVPVGERRYVAVAYPM